MLTFVVPVRHHESVPNWQMVKSFIKLTADSIAAQTSKNWNAVVVANSGADLPVLPRKFEVERVDFAAPMLSKIGPRETYYDGIRRDKGARIWAGVTAMEPHGHIMVADYDDLVSNRLAGFVERHSDAPGWYIDRGYRYDGSLILRTLDGFNETCGTSLIVNSSLYRPDEGEDLNEFVRAHVGSHKFIKARLAGRGTPLASLPFRGAVYRVGHEQASSSSSKLSELINPLKPRRTFDALRRTRMLSAAKRDEFFAGRLRRQLV